jgi:hypothetical protein
LDAIEIENPGSPGKCIKPTERVYSFLDENTQSIMDRTTAKKVFGDRKNLRPDTVKDYDQHRKGLRPDTVKDYDHNSNRKETYNKNSLKGERDFSNKIQITPSDSHSFVEALNQSNLLEAFTDKVKADPETKNLKPETIIKHFGEKNTGHTYTSSIELLDRFDGYMTRKLYKNINLPASVPSVVRAGRLI